MAHAADVPSDAPILPDEYTIYIAIFGAIVGTVSLAISIWLAFRDRGRIFVSARPGYKVEGNSEYDTEKIYIMINIVNKGRRPVTITKSGFRLKSQSLFFETSDSTRKGPREVREGQAISDLLALDLIDIADVDYVYAIDATGKEYRGKVIQD